jgi:hypothetical protein
MFNIFDKIFIDLADRFTSKYDYITISTEKSFHPVAKFIENDFGESPAFTDYLDETFEGSEDKFWLFLINKTSKDNFIVYTDPPLYHRLQLTYFKNVFPNSNSDDLFQLYTFFSYNEDIRSKLEELRGGEKLRTGTEHFPKYNLKEFEDVILKLPKLESLYSLDKAKVCFEFLFLQYLNNRNCTYAAYFLKRVKSLAWEQWFEEIGELRTEIINGFYQVKKLGLNESFDIKKDLNIFLRKNNIDWIADLNLYGNNPDYFKRNYKPEDFYSLLHSKDRAEFSSDIDFNEHLNTNLLKKMTFLFNDRYEDLLLSDAKDSIGCSFTKGKMQSSFNNLLLSYFYSALNNETELFGSSLTLSEKKLVIDD